RTSSGARAAGTARAAKGGAAGRSRAALRTTRDCIAENAAGDRTDDQGAGRVVLSLANAIAVIRILLDPIVVVIGLRRRWRRRSVTVIRRGRRWRRRIVLIVLVVVTIIVRSIVLIIVPLRRGGVDRAARCQGPGQKRETGF